MRSFVTAVKANAHRAECDGVGVLRWRRDFGGQTGLGLYHQGSDFHGGPRTPAVLVQMQIPRPLLLTSQSDCSYSDPMTPGE